MTEVVNDWPPNIEAIREVLPVSDRNIFAYDEVIYNPGAGALSNALIAHEEVHFSQQASTPGGPEQWWKKFLASPSFRLSQEIDAHRMEWRVWLASGRRSRLERRVMLKSLSKRLAAPMYGGIISIGKAKKAIKS